MSAVVDVTIENNSIEQSILIYIDVDTNDNIFEPVVYNIKTYLVRIPNEKLATTNLDEMFNVVAEAILDELVSATLTNQAMKIIRKTLAPYDFENALNSEWKAIGYMESEQLSIDYKPESIAGLAAGKVYQYKAAQKPIPMTAQDLNKKINELFPKQTSISSNPAAEIKINHDLPSVSTMPGFDEIINSLPGVMERVKSPVEIPFSSPSQKFTIKDIIIHLNDTSKWTREQIADWLETLDVDLRFKSPDVKLREQRELELKTTQQHIDDYHAAIKSQQEQIAELTDSIAFMKESVDICAKQVQTLKELLNEQD